MTAMIPRLALLALIASVCGCTGDRDAGPGRSGQQEDDVVETEQGAWNASTAWTVGAEPTLEIGSETPGYQFAGIRGAVRLSDGRISVGDAGSSEVRLYDPEGKLISKIGRAGGGPEEFRSLGKLVRAAGDSVVVFDAASRRVSVLDRDGRVARTFTPHAATAGARLAGVLDNGSFVFGVPLALPPRAGLSRDTIAYLLVSPDGSVADTLGIAPGGQQFQQANGNHVARLSLPFGPTAAAIAGGERIVFGATDRYELHEYGPDGSATRILRRKVVPQPFTNAHDRQATEGFPPQIAARLAEVPRPAQVPVFASMLMDGQNNLWVKDHPSPQAVSVAWTVFDHRGSMLGQVQLPVNLRITDIGDDYVLGVWPDDLGVERVRMYPLRKP